MLPFHYSSEKQLPSWAMTRVEGMPLNEAFWHGINYLRKYKNGKYAAPIEQTIYFDQQRVILKSLINEPAEGGARLGMVGDLMWIRNGWNDFLSPPLLRYLNEHDAVIGNLETPISPKLPVPAFFPDYFTYNSDPRLLTSFRRDAVNNTFSALSVANNHCLDRGDAGLVDTIRFLKNIGISYSGVQLQDGDCPWVQINCQNIPVGFYAACWGLNNPELGKSSSHKIEILDGLLYPKELKQSLDRIKSILHEMKISGIRFRIIYLHWGHEFEFYPTPEMMVIGREVIKAGADVVVGSHPHVIQPAEVLFLNGYSDHWPNEVKGPFIPESCKMEDTEGIPRKGIIAYSLGNFTTAMFTIPCRVGLILSLKLIEQSSGFVDWKFPAFEYAINSPTKLLRSHHLSLGSLKTQNTDSDCLYSSRVKKFMSFLDRHLLG